MVCIRARIDFGVAHDNLATVVGRKKNQRIVELVLCLQLVHEQTDGGIRPDPDHPGFERFILKPCFLPGIEWARADYESVKGKISSHWKRDKNSVHWTVTVPESSVARVELPSGIVVNGETIGSAGLELNAGEWTLDVCLIQRKFN